MMILLNLLALIALAVATAAIYMAMLQSFPVEWLYYQYFLRKPLTWTILLASVLWVGWTTSRTGIFPLGSLIPLLLMGLAVILAYRMHQEVVFQAVDFPAMAEDPFSLPLTDEMQLAIIEYGGVTKAYPLDYVVHHHIVNDRFGDRIVALTYCAMCRSIIPFDVTDIGPLFVASFKHGNMIVGDGRVRAVLDWELCTLGDPLADVGYLMNNWVGPGEEVAGSSGPTIVGGFGERDALLARYQELTGRDVSGIDYYRAFSYWRLAAIVEGVLKRYLEGAMGDSDGDTDNFRQNVENLANRALSLLRP